MRLPAGLVRIGGVLNNKNYRIWLGGNLLSLIGMWAQRIGVGWLAWELTGSVFWVGIIAAADMAPGLIVAPYAGIIADRRNRLTLVRQSQGISALISGAMAVMVISGTAQIYPLFVLAMAQGITMAFKQPARMALTRSLVPEKDLSTAIALNAVLFNLARFVGPLVAGALILSVGVTSVFVFAFFGSVVFVVAVHYVKTLPKTEIGLGPGGTKPAPLVGAGFGYTFRHKGIGPLLILQFTNGFFIRGFTEILPGYSDIVLGQGAEGLAVLSAGIGIGAMASGFWLAQRDGVAGLTRHIFVAQAIASVMVLGMAGTNSLVVATGFVGLAGFMLATTSIAAQTLIQRSVAEDRLARVMSVFGVVMRGSPAIGALVMGAAADYAGFGIPIIVGGLLSLASVVLVFGREKIVRAEFETVQ